MTSNFIEIIESLNNDYDELYKKYKYLQLRYELPVIFYTSQEEYDSTLKDSLRSLQMGCHKIIKYKYPQKKKASVEIYGTVNINTDSNSKLELMNLLKKSLESITLNQAPLWCESYVNKLLELLNISVLTEKGFFEDIYVCSAKNLVWTNSQIAHYVYQTIRFHLINEDSGILDKMIMYKCNCCISIGTCKDFCFSGNICDNCNKADLVNYNRKKIFIKGVGNIEIPYRNTEEMIISLVDKCKIDIIQQMFLIHT